MEGLVYAIVIVAGAVLGRLIGAWALLVPVALAAWIITNADLEGDIEWLVGVAFGTVAALGVAAGAYARRRARGGVQGSRGGGLSS